MLVYSNPPERNHGEGNLKSVKTTFHKEPTPRRKVEIM